MHALSCWWLVEQMSICPSDQSLSESHDRPVFENKQTDTWLVCRTWFHSQQDTEWEWLSRWFCSNGAFVLRSTWMMWSAVDAFCGVQVSHTKTCDLTLQQGNMKRKYSVQLIFCCVYFYTIYSAPWQRPNLDKMCRIKKQERNGKKMPFPDNRETGPLWLVTNAQSVQVDSTNFNDNQKGTDDILLTIHVFRQLWKRKSRNTPNLRTPSA